MNNPLALAIWSERRYLMRYATARALWRTASDLEDGISETIMRAIRASFDPRRSSLRTWLTTIMWRVRSNELHKGYDKSKPISECRPRVVYTGAADYADHVANLCDPESILIATETYAS
jgi:DNA-directed RNA polymerase specialized sigma24 family protein